MNNIVKKNRYIDQIHTDMTLSSQSDPEKIMFGDSDLKRC